MNVRRAATLVLAIVNSAAIAVTVTGRSLDILRKNPHGRVGLVGLALAILAVQLGANWLLGFRRGTRQYKEGSRWFNRFFVSFYGRPGLLRVYCSNLRWLENPDAKKILDKLVAKGTDATVYVRDGSGPVVGTLQAAHVNVCGIPKGIALKSRMTLRVNDDSRVLIVRKPLPSSEGDEKKISVLTTRDPFTCGIAEDLLNTCDAENIPPAASE